MPQSIIRNLTLIAVHTPCTGMLWVLGVACRERTEDKLCWGDLQIQMIIQRFDFQKNGINYNG